MLLRPRSFLTYFPTWFYRENLSFYLCRIKWMNTWIFSPINTLHWFAFYTLLWLAREDKPFNLESREGFNSFISYYKGTSLIVSISACRVLKPPCARRLVFLPSESFKRSYDHTTFLHIVALKLLQLLSPRWFVNTDLHVRTRVTTRGVFSYWTLRARNLADLVTIPVVTAIWVKEHINGLLRGGECLAVMWVTLNVVNK